MQIEVLVPRIYKYSYFNSAVQDNTRVLGHLKFIPMAI